MKIFKLLSLLLSYPDHAMKASLSELKQCAKECAQEGELDSFFSYLEDNTLISLQERYVAIFDRNLSYSLHLFEHLHGEDRVRGQAMVNLLEEYDSEGFELEARELPDYLPLFLEFLSLCEQKKSITLLNEAINVIAHIADKLKKENIIYQHVFNVLLNLATVKPERVIFTTARGMDQAIEKFGTTNEGIEPLLKPCLGTQMGYDFQQDKMK